MNIPPMDWHGWWTIVLPMYLVISFLIALFLDLIDFNGLLLIYHLSFEIILILIAVSISVFAYRRYDQWHKSIVISLLVVDIVFIFNTSVLFYYLLL